MNTHIDTLTAWWENAEEGQASAGDTLIWQKPDSAYEVFTAEATDDTLGNRIRILARAPKPKPAWHGAVAVIAHDGRHRRQVFARGLGGLWVDGGGEGIRTEDLRDVTPLIEAKVTDEMVKRARAASMKWEFGGISENATHAILAAALGLETE